MVGTSLKARAPLQVKLGLSILGAARLKFKGLFLCLEYAVLICQILSISASPAAAVCIKYSASLGLEKQQKQRPAAFFM